MKKRKKFNKKIMSLLVILGIVIGIANLYEKEVFAATDYTSQVVIADWDLLDDAGIPASTTNEVASNSKWQFTVKWELNPMGTTLQENDTFRINLPANSITGTWGTGNSAYQSFTDTNGVVIGEWRVNANQIEVVFNSNVNGSSGTAGEFTTGKSVVEASYGSTITQNQDVTVGDVTKVITFRGSTLIPVLDGDGKYMTTTSNSEIGWYVSVGRLELVNLIANEGQSYTSKDVYLEDTIIDGGTLNSAIELSANIIFPNDLSNPQASNLYQTYDVTSKFAQLTQNNGESYNDFKARLAPLQYGVYTNTDGTETIVVNFGELGANGLKYSDVDPNFADTMASVGVNGTFYPESARSDLVDFFNTTYGDSNVIGGNVAMFSMKVQTKYDKVINDTVKTNTAIVTENAVSKNLSASATLRGNMGNVILSATNAGLFLSDEENGVLLSNATFKLQILNGATWTDYTAAGTMTTDADGFIETPNLGNGTYRFVEVTPPSNEYDILNSQGYDAGVGSVISSQFTIDSNASEGPKVNVTNIKYKYDVRYTKGNHGTFSDEEYLDRVINSNTPTFSGTLTGESGYHFTNWSPEVSSTVTKDVTYVAQWDSDVYDITYVLNGGINDSSNPTTYTYGIGIDSFKNPTREGYKFLGWIDRDGNNITNISSTAMGDKELVANWKKIEVTTPSDSQTTDKSAPSNLTKTIAKSGNEMLMLAGILLSIGTGISFLTLRKSQ